MQTSASPAGGKAFFSFLKYSTVSIPQNLRFSRHSGSSDGFAPLISRLIWIYFDRISSWSLAKIVWESRSGQSVSQLGCACQMMTSHKYLLSRRIFQMSNWLGWVVLWCLPEHNGAPHAWQMFLGRTSTISSIWVAANLEVDGRGQCCGDRNNIWLLQIITVFD